MVKRYFDSSAFLSLYFDEDQGERIHELLKMPGTTMTSQLALVELSSALRRSLRAKRITRRQHAEISSQADSHLKHVRMISLSSDVVMQAKVVADATGLRSLDALHVASAKACGADVVVTFDHEMAAAAKDLGMKVEA